MSCQWHLPCFQAVQGFFHQPTRIVFGSSSPGSQKVEACVIMLVQHVDSGVVLTVPGVSICVCHPCTGVLLIFSVSIGSRPGGQRVSRWSRISSINSTGQGSVSLTLHSGHNLLISDPSLSPYMSALLHTLRIQCSLSPSSYTPSPRVSICMCHPCTGVLLIFFVSIGSRPASTPASHATGQRGSWRDI